jgi:hypothetical protein
MCRNRHHEALEISVAKQAKKCTHYLNLNVLILDIKLNILIEPFLPMVIEDISNSIHVSSTFGPSFGAPGFCKKVVEVFELYVHPHVV